jgi:hypothetical protein
MGICNSKISKRKISSQANINNSMENISCNTSGTLDISFDRISEKTIVGDIYQHYKIGEVLGEGKFGIVRKGK